MIKKVILGAVVGGVILFVWNSVSWRALPWHNNTLMAFNNEADLVDAVKARADTSGVYILPNPHRQPAGLSADEAAVAEARSKELYEQGFLMFATVHAGAPKSMGLQMIKSLVLQILTAGLVTWMLIQTSIKGVGGCIGFALVFALAVSTFVYLPQWNRWYFSAGYTFVAVADALIGWTLVGLALARITK